jgi:hypothetical protein
MLTILEMASPHVEMEISFPGMITRVEVCEPSEERPRIFRKWMEVESVENKAKDLFDERDLADDIYHRMEKHTYATPTNRAKAPSRSTSEVRGDMMK